MNWRDGATPLLVELADHAAAALRDGLGMDPSQAEYAGYIVMCRVVESMGGSSIYLPKIDSVRRHDRDLAIWAEFRGDNHAELARRHGVTTIHIYRVVKRMRARQVEADQRTLFPVRAGNSD